MNLEIKSIQIPIKKVSDQDLEKTLLFLQFIDLLAKNEKDSVYLPDYFDENQILIFREFLNEESEFDYEIFFLEFNKLLSGRFHLLILGYKDLVDKYCKPDSEILEPVNYLVPSNENELLVKAEEVCEFTSFNMWVNKARDWIGSFSPNEKIICVDKNGNTLTGGFDFQYADSINLFPIKAYRLIRNTDEKIIKSISNN